MKVVEVVRDWHNKLLNRRELEFIISFDSSTPKRQDIVEFLANQYGVPPERIVVCKIINLFGSLKARVHAHIYDSVEYVKRFEPKHILKKHSAIPLEGGKVGKAS